MKKEEKRAFVEDCKCDANNAKHRLIEIAGALESVGAFREAKRLETIIEKLEIWQNT